MSFESLNAKFGEKKGFVKEKIKNASTGRARAAHSEPRNNAKPVKIPGRLKSLLDVLGDDDIDQVAAVYRECMVATTRHWVDEGKDDKGRVLGYWETVPDFKTRLAAANMVAAYMDGLPIQRQLTLAGKFKDLSEMMGQLQDSPQGQQLLAELPAIDVESSVQETGAQSGNDSPSETAGGT